MNKIKIILFIVLLSFMLYSCGKNTEKNGIALNNIHLSGINNKTFSDEFNLVEIIALETTDESLIKDIERIIKTDSLFVILNSDFEVLLFDSRNGKLINHIKNIGIGPLEYSKILDIAFDRKSHQIIIYDESNKLIYYSVDCNPINAKRISNGIFQNILYKNNDIICYNKLEKGSSLIQIYDVNKNTFNSKLKKQTTSFPMFLYCPQIIESQSVWFTQPLDNGIYKINNQQIEKVYEVSIENFGLSDKQKSMLYNNTAELFSLILENNITYTLAAVRETNKRIYFATNRIGLASIDKSTNNVDVYVFGNISDETNELYNMQYFAHDGDDNYIICIVSPEDYLNSKFSVTNIHGITEDSNPLLFLYEEK
jgi:hypothetical protein